MADPANRREVAAYPAPGPMFAKRPLVEVKQLPHDIFNNYFIAKKDYR